MTSEDTVPAALRRLWRLAESPRLGRPAALDVDRVVTAAVETADRDGLDGVTLPKVAKGLGVTGMSLYRYVGSKDELLVLMGDHALGAPPRFDAADWREGLRAWARAQRAVYRRRPWLAQLPVAGPPSGPHRIAWMEAALEILARTPLDWAHKIGTLSLIGGYVVQTVRQDHELARGRAEGQGQSDAERAYGRALAKLVDPERFPETARLFSSPLFEAGPADTSDAAIGDADFTIGLELILDGIATRIERLEP
ncbi:TetR/AcrR family transcriptional regulator [Streptomyces sp. NK15101]|uniref:TetR/AcrR family transcriptional regulator n=1 Tax=Streptomyces sp. NK15101 TaxID=2873261 RepID=UPI001CECA659|nr:TetR/AcrR family transcriptional regulator [Streptomyces sp. NK15101]